ncbi:MAG: VTT domain-containing protein [Minisyncoccia bacterium]
MWFSLNTLFGWVLAYRYAVLLPIAIVEGPIISVIAGFLVSIHAMEFWIAFGILMFGDVIGDILLYSVGRWGGSSLIMRWGPKFGATPERMEKFEKLFKNNAKKTLLFGKWGHAFGFPILVSAGIVKENFQEFLWVSVVGTIPKTLFLLAIGFYFGAAYQNIDRYFTDAIIGIVIVVIIAAVVYWFLGNTVRRYFDETA